jgi:hypothetical protein
MKKQQLSIPAKSRKTPWIHGGGGGLKSALVLAALLCAFGMSGCDDGSTDPDGGNVNLAGTTWVWSGIISEVSYTATFIFSSGTYTWTSNIGGDQNDRGTYTVSGSTINGIRTQHNGGSTNDPWTATVSGSQLNYLGTIYTKQ